MDLTQSFNFRGIEAVFENHLRGAILNRKTPGFHYLEIGTATGWTLSQVANVLHEMVPTSWRATGIDLMDGPFFDLKQFFKWTLAHEVSVEFNGSGSQNPFVSDTRKNDIRLLLLKSGDKRAMISPGSINFALIDGCHGAPCVMNDFLSIEGGIVDGGIVAFHDAGEQDQGIHFQNHCRQPIGIVAALHGLGLIGNLRNNTGSLKRHWTHLGTFPGDKTPDDLQKNGHGIAFFQKTI